MDENKGGINPKSFLKTPIFLVFREIEFFDRSPGFTTGGVILDASGTISVSNAQPVPL